MLRLQEFTSGVDSLVRRAYKVALGSDKSGDEPMVYTDFRLFIFFIHDFCHLDTIYGVDHDEKITKDAFLESIPLMRKWGLKVQNPDATFLEVDRESVGYTNFDDYGTWAVNQRLNAYGERNFID